MLARLDLDRLFHKLQYHSGRFEVSCQPGCQVVIPMVHAILQ